MSTQLTPQQRMAFAFRGFDEPEVEKLGEKSFRAFAVKLVNGRPQFAEILANTAEGAVEALARLVARP